jgi:hypothetical protein
MDPPSFIELAFYIQFLANFHYDPPCQIVGGFISGLGVGGNGKLNNPFVNLLNGEADVFFAFASFEKMGFIVSVEYPRILNRFQSFECGRIGFVGGNRQMNRHGAVAAPPEVPGRSDGDHTPEYDATVKQECKQEKEYMPLSHWQRVCRQTWKLSIFEWSMMYVQTNWFSTVY